MSSNAEVQARGAAGSGRHWLTAILLLTGPLPLVVQHLSQLWARVEYRCFPVILIASLALLIRDRSERLTPSSHRDWAWLWWFFGLLITAGGFLLDSPWLGMLAFLLLIRGILVRLKYAYFGGWWLSLLLLPLPLGYDQQFNFWLQHLSTILSSRFLGWLHVPHLVVGNTLRTESGVLMVAEACSGISSLVALMAFAAAWSAWLRRSAIGIFLLVALASVWAVLMNSVRIAAIAWASASLDQDWSTGVSHELVGMATFLLAAAGLWSTEPLVYFLTGPIGEPQWREEELHANPWIRWWNQSIAPAEPQTVTTTSQEIEQPKFSRVCAVVSVLLFVVTFAYLPPVFGSMVANRPALQRIYKLTADFMPAQWQGFEQQKFETDRRAIYDVWGEHTRRWDYSGESGSLLLSIDFPFLRWHELGRCYEAIGWKILDKVKRIVPATEDDVCILTLEKPDGQVAVLAYLLIDEQTNPVSSSRPAMSTLMGKIMMATRSKGWGSVSTQVQCLLTPSGAISTSDAQALAEASLLDATRRLRGYLNQPAEVE